MELSADGAPGKVDDPRRAPGRGALGLRARRRRHDAPRSSGTSPGKSELELLDLKTGKSILQPEAAGGDRGRARLLAATASRSRSSLSGAATPADIWVMDVAHRRLPPGHAAARTPASTSSKLVRPELLRFKAHDGLELSGWLYKPATRRRRRSRPSSPSTAAPRARSGPVFNSTVPGAPLARHRRLRAERPRLLRVRKEASSTSTTARCASRASRTSRTASTRS